MKFVGDNPVMNASGEQSAVKAALAACWRSVVRGLRAATVHVLAPCCLFVCVAALQVLFVGAADTLGLAPQVSFLSLNLALVALFSWLALPRMRLSLKRGRGRKTAIAEARATGGGAFSLDAAPPTRPACKVLVIRRLTVSARAGRREAWRVLDGRSKSREVTVDA
jgi:hypothetical protein